MHGNNLLRFVRRLLLKNQSLWSLGSNGVSALAGLLLFAFSSSRLSATDFGIWVLFQTVNTLMEMFRTGLLLPGYLQLSAGRTKKSKLHVFESVTFIFVLITVGQAAVCWSLHLAVAANSSWNFFFTNYPWVVLSGGVVTLTEWWFQSIVRFHVILVLRTANRLLMVVFIYFFAFDLSRLILVQVLVNTIMGVIILVFMRVPNIKRIKFDGVHGRILFNFGKYATPSQMLANLLRSSDTLMISYAMGAAATGIYGAAAKFLEFVELPIRSFGAVNFNQLAALANAGKHHDALTLARQKVWRLTLRVLPLAALLCIFAPQLIMLVSGQQYLSSIPVLRVMAIYCIFIPADRYCGLLLESFGRPDLNLIKVFVMLVSNVLGNAVAIWYFNTPVSIATSSIVTFSVGVGFGFWLVTRAIPQPAFPLSVSVNRP